MVGLVFYLILPFLLGRILWTADSANPDFPSPSFLSMFPVAAGLAGEVTALPWSGRSMCSAVQLRRSLQESQGGWQLHSTLDKQGGGVLHVSISQGS